MEGVDVGDEDGREKQKGRDMEARMKTRRMKSRK